MSDVAITTSLLSLAAVLGLWLGQLKVKGVGLGIGGVLFGGILIGHFTKKYGLELEAHTMHFIQEFGLILFVYTIGIQVGPGFFSSLKKSGLKLNLLALMIVALGSLSVVALYLVMDLPLPVILGIYSGAVTNTPSLGAGQQILAELGLKNSTEIMGMAYAMAYPFGICGILLSFWLIRLFFKVNIEHEHAQFEKQSGNDKEALNTINVRITNPNMDELKIRDIPGFEGNNVICSRLKRRGELILPSADTQVQMGDIVHLVGDQRYIRRVQLVLGQLVDESLTTKGTTLRSVRVVVTHESAFGKKISQLREHDVVVSRLNRAGIELVPTGDMTLQFGDVLNLVGETEAIDAVVEIVGNAQKKLQQVQMLPVFIGILLGVLLGSIPIAIPGMPVPLKLGLAGGPLIVAIILSRIGTIGKFYWFMPPSANLALREIGIVLFLAVVGLKAGGGFFDTLIHGEGIKWLVIGMIITLVPLMITGVVARVYGKLNYLTLSGLLAGSMTDPPALAFATSIKEESGAAALAYSTVYPLVMFTRIISPQLLAILLWAIK